MAYDHQIAVTAAVVARVSHLAVECGIDRIARFERQVDALMRPSASQAVARAHASEVWIVIAFERVYEHDSRRFGQRRQLDVVIGVDRRGIPVVGEDGRVLHVILREDVAPRVVVEEHYSQRIVARRQCIDRGNLAYGAYGIDRNGRRHLSIYLGAVGCGSRCCLHRVLLRCQTLAR